MTVAFYTRSLREEEALQDLIMRRLSRWLTARTEPVTIVNVPACVMHGRDGGVFPINELRWYAVACAESEFVFYLDVDFVPSHNASGVLPSASWLLTWHVALRIT